jgi:hypothetical protein
MLSEAELDERLRLSDPVAREALEQAGVRAALASLWTDVAQPEGAPKPPPRRTRPALRARWALPAVALATAASLIGVETLSGGTVGAGLPLAAVPSAAAAQLDKVAHAAAAQPVPARGQWGYQAMEVRSTETAKAGDASLRYVVTLTIQNWTRPHGPQRQRIISGGFSFFTAADKAAYLADPSGFDPQINRMVAALNGGHTRTYTGVVWDRFYRHGVAWEPPWESSPPKRPKALIRAIWKQWIVPRPNPAHAGLVADWPELLFGSLFNLLTNSTSPSLRATAYAALAYVPDTRVTGNQTDQLGRSGIGIALALKGSHGTPSFRSRIIVSPGTGDVLEEDGISTGGAGELPAGTVVQREIFVSSGLVGSDTALPDGGRQPFRPVVPRGTKAHHVKGAHD